MQIIKSKNQELKMACQNLIEARKLKSKSEKLEKGSKDFISCELTKHGIDLKQLPVGETLIIKLDGEDCIRVTAKGVNRVDLSLLSIKYPAIDQECRKEFVCVYFDPLIAQEETDSFKVAVSDLYKHKKELEQKLGDLKKTIKAVENK